MDYQYCLMTLRIKRETASNAHRYYNIYYKYIDFILSDFKEAMFHEVALKSSCPILDIIIINRIKVSAKEYDLNKEK